MTVKEISVLIESTHEKAHGFIPSKDWSDKPVTPVRRWRPSINQNLKFSQLHKVTEQQRGSISAEEWARLRGLLSLKDRLHTGDWSPIEGPISNEVQQLFFAPAAPKSRGKKPKVPLGPQHRKTIYGRYGSHDYPALRCVEINGISVSPILALMEAITARLSLTRFVIWWSDVDGELVPGLYCPDRLTAYYAFAIRSIGAVGGWAICQRCGKNYLRRRTHQLYCTHNCQVAAAMKRFRGCAREIAEAKKEPSQKTKISSEGK